MAWSRLSPPLYRCPQPIHFVHLWCVVYHLLNWQHHDFAHLSKNSSRHRKPLFHVTNSSHLFHPEGPTALGWNKENRIDGVEEGVSWLRKEIYRLQTISIKFWYWVGSSVLCCYIQLVLQAFAVSVFVPLVIGRDFNLARNIFESLHLRLKHNFLYYL